MEISQVKYGRRRGQSRNTPSPQTSQGQNESFEDIQQPIDLNQVSVLTQADWNRIQGHLTRNVREKELIETKRAEKLALHQHSKDMVKNWSNTIAGQRQKKLEARKLKEEEEEKQKVKIDIEEAKFQAQKRKEAIEKAKTLQYYQTDRVKGFHGALLLTEVLKEREMQIELKKARKAASGGKDKDALLRHQKDLELGILEDHKKATEALKERQEIAEFQKEQIHQHIVDLEKEIKEGKEEGEELRKQLLHYEAEKAKIEAIRKKEKEELMGSHLQTVSDRDLIRSCERQQEEEEEEEIRIFAAAKKKMTKLRKERERDLFQKKQDQVTKMVNKLDLQLKQKTDDEDARIIKCQAEREAEREKEALEKQEQLQRALREEAEHQRQQMQQKEKKKREEKRRELMALKMKMEADKLFAQKQIEKMQQRKQEAKGHQKFLIKQAIEKQVVLQKEMEEQLEMYMRNLDLLALEEKQFQEYASKVIDHCEKGGRNTYPLHKAAREGHGGGRGPVFEGKGGVRPSYLVQDNSGVELPNYQRGDTDEVKYAHVGHPSNTTKRLGFVW
ncbi:putative coiled-coil domain-containing protein [Apostichopus japonicus]|uniref:Putative coiled-coil domain-containing protein n=1 Tax=Stichopus japonicus TaxID=307972 RepID=A0A2G8KGL3_STIJA|nr:putative coiled-coil domain-containing protein [Apostichopus japonicus]